jgi:HD-GYP domain-containing protein (c-di-GMP phosphodiesterase class II)
MNSRKRDLINNFLRTFIPAVTHAHQYTAAHQLTAAAINNAYTHLMEAIGKDLSLSFMIIDDRIIMYDEPLEDTLFASRFVRIFKHRGIQHMRILQGITEEEMTALIEMLTARSPLPENMDLPNIQLGKVSIGFRTTGNGEGFAVGGSGDTHFGAIRATSENLASDVYHAVRNNGKLPLTEIKNTVTNLITAIRHESSVLLSFCPLRILDEYTFTHSTNVCVLNLAQAMALGIKGDALRDIGVAALLHDTGKLYVPEEILNKPGKLTNSEWETIRSHPQRGAEYLLDNPGIPPLAVVVAYEHHMQYDNSGYPSVHKDWRQNVCSQMTAISDFFDAMRTKRIYRDAVETRMIADQMVKMSGTALNPVLTKNFLILLEKMDQTHSTENGDS